MNTAILCLGSNNNKEVNLKKALSLLQSHFPEIRFSSPVYTQPENISNPELFLNQIAILQTPETRLSVNALLKSFETRIGRTSEDKKRHRIPIDIDIIRWNEEILKQEDMLRPFVIDGIKELCSEKSQKKERP